MSLYLAAYINACVTIRYIFGSPRPPLLLINLIFSQLHNWHIVCLIHHN